MLGRVTTSEVEAPTSDRRQQPGAHTFTQRNLRWWFLRDEGGDRPRYQRRHCRGERADAQSPPRARTELLEVLPGAAKLPEHSFRMPDNNPSGLGRLHAARLAFEKCLTSCLLHERDLAGDCRLGVAQHIGRYRERAVAGCLADHA